MSEDRMWQLCPKCNGEGLCAGDPFEGLNTIISTIPVTCRICCGRGIINVISGLPPVFTLNTQKEENSITE